MKRQMNAMSMPAVGVLLVFLFLIVFLTGCPPNSNNQPPSTPTPTATASPVPTVEPSPTATATPNNGHLTSGPLSIAGKQFKDRNGVLMTFKGAIICCENAKANGWPFVTKEMLDKFATYGVNFTHVRLGPNTPSSEGLEFLAYKNAGNNKVDLNDWNQAFWDLLKSTIDHAGKLGIYVELDLIDGWVLERDQIHAWAQNINGISEGNCYILEKYPTATAQKWIRKIIKETAHFDNVLYQISNESFDCLQKVKPEWEINVARIARDEMAKNNYPLHPIGTNSTLWTIEDHPEIDYINRHAKTVQGDHSKPIMINEYNNDFIVDTGVNGFASFYNAGKAKKQAVHLWRGNLSDSQFEAYLKKLKTL